MLAPRADAVWTGVGATLVTLGSAAVGAGLFGSLLSPTSDSEPPSTEYYLGGVPGVALLLGGSVGVAVQALLLSLGTRKLSKEQCVRVSAYGEGEPTCPFPNRLRRSAGSTYLGNLGDF